MSATLYDATVGALTIKQCQSADFSPNNRIEAARASAALLPSELILMSSEPRARWTSQDIATIVGGVDELTGLNVASGNIYIPWRARANGGTFGGAGTGVRLTGTHGLLIPVSLTANINQLATVDLELGFRCSEASGFTAPVAFTGSLTLSDTSYTGTFRLGPTTLDSVAVNTIQGITVNYGLQLEFEYDVGPYPVAMYITQSDPTIDVRFRSMALLNTYGPMFKACGGAVFSLVANDDGGSTIALTEDDHITITAGAGISDIQNVSGQGNSIAEPTLRLYTKSLSIAAGQALAGGGD